jgi:hypothetical protein
MRTFSHGAFGDPKSMGGVKGGVDGALKGKGRPLSWGVGGGGGDYAVTVASGSSVGRE